MDSTAKFLLAVLILLPFDYAIIKFVDLWIYKLKNSNKRNKKENKIDQEQLDKISNIDKEF